MNHARHWALVVLASLAFAVRAAGLDAQSLWRDEVDAIRFSTSPLHELAQMFLTPGHNGPLYFVLLRPWLGLAGNSEFALRFFSLFFGVLSVPLAFRVARELFPRASGVPLLAAALVTTSPYLIWYSQEGKMYTLVVALVLASTCALLGAIRCGGWRWWTAYVALTSLSFYVHLIAALILPAHVLMFFLMTPDRRARLAPWLLSLAALTIPYLPLLAWQAPLLLQEAETGYLFFPLGQLARALLMDYSLGVASGAAPWELLPFAALILAALLLLVRRSGDRPAGVWAALAWLIVPVLAFYLITLRRPMFTTRYLVFVLPAYLFLLAAGLAAASRLSRPGAAALLAGVLILNGSNVYAQARTPLKADFRAATAHVLTHMAPNDLIVFQIPYGRYSFEYYRKRQFASDTWQAGRPVPDVASGPYRWAEGLYTNAGMAPEEADRLMAEMTTGSHVVWLIASEVPMWDARNLVQDWLERHGTRTDETEFVRVTVVRYELTGF